jgi:hypothetical protein
MTMTDSSVRLDSKTPAGPLEDKWATYKDDVKLVNPNNKRKFKVIVVGTGLAASRSLDCCPGRHQRRQELPRRR